MPGTVTQTGTSRYVDSGHGHRVTSALRSLRRQGRHGTRSLSDTCRGHSRPQRAAVERGKYGRPQSVVDSPCSISFSAGLGQSFSAGSHGAASAGSPRSGWIDGTDRHGSLLMRPCLSDPQGGQHAIDEVAVLAVGQMACRDLKGPHPSGRLLPNRGHPGVRRHREFDLGPCVVGCSVLRARSSEDPTASYRWILVRDDG
jgi:hypothetical protein